MDQNLILNFALYAVPVVLAITLHEAAHGYVARMFGDPTAHEQGRITLNPLKHIDPMGTILLPAVLIAMNTLSGAHLPVFGWARPVPVNFGRLRHPKRDMLWVAAAGPAVNFVQALCWVLLLGVLAHFVASESIAQYVVTACTAGLASNLALAVLNLIPIPPLDGGRIAVSLLPGRAAWSLARIEPFGFYILFALLWLKLLDRPLNFAIDTLSSLLLGLVF